MGPSPHPKGTQPCWLLALSFQPSGVCNDTGQPSEAPVSRRAWQHHKDPAHSRVSSLDQAAPWAVFRSALLVCQVCLRGRLLRRVRWGVTDTPQGVSTMDLALMPPTQCVH